MLVKPVLSEAPMLHKGGWGHVKMPPRNCHRIGVISLEEPRDYLFFCVCVCAHLPRSAARLHLYLGHRKQQSSPRALGTGKLRRKAASENRWSRQRGEESFVLPQFHGWGTVATTPTGQAENEWLNPIWNDHLFKNIPLLLFFFFLWVDPTSGISLLRREGLFSPPTPPPHQPSGTLKCVRKCKT